eukprot:GHVL01020898.1.p1 GENE.GHVL01020898.1~~GHVL01020898.1.p1  ORF type:complete len:309 (-),score=76.04 GHVL01020898.1:617-1519(-)
MKSMSILNIQNGLLLYIYNIYNDGQIFNIGFGGKDNIVLTSKGDIWCNKKSKINVYSAKLESGKRDKFGCTIGYDQRAEDSDESFIVMAQDFEIDETLASSVISFTTAVTAVDENMVFRALNATEAFVNLILYVTNITGLGEDSTLSFPGGGVLVGSYSDQIQTVVDLALTVHATLVQWADTVEASDGSLTPGSFLTLFADVVAAFAGAFYQTPEVNAANWENSGGISISVGQSSSDSPNFQIDDTGGGFKGMNRRLTNQTSWKFLNQSAMTHITVQNGRSMGNRRLEENSYWTLNSLRL